MRSIVVSDFVRRWKHICGIVLILGVFLNIAVITRPDDCRYYIASPGRLFSPDVAHPLSPEALRAANMQQALRLKVLREGCARTSPLRGTADLDALIANRRTLLTNFIYNDEHKVVYCQVPKVSCTQWKKVFAILEGLIPISHLELDVDRDIVHAMKNHPRLSRLSEEEARTRLETYRFFMFVRHPLERLVSAYRDKVEKPLSGSNYFKTFGPLINLRYRELYPGENHTDEMTFDKFINWMGSGATKKPKWGEREHEHHWEPAHAICHPCIVNYTVIGHHEQLLEEADYVMQLAGISGVEFPRKIIQSNSDPHGTSAITPAYFAQIPDEALRRGLARLYSDFILFGYNPEEVFKDGQDRKRVRRIFDTLSMDDVYREPWCSENKTASEVNEAIK